MRTIKLTDELRALPQGEGTMFTILITADGEQRVASLETPESVSPVILWVTGFMEDNAWVTYYAEASPDTRVEKQVEALELVAGERVIMHGSAYRFREVVENNALFTDENGDLCHIGLDCRWQIRYHP